VRTSRPRPDVLAFGLALGLVAWPAIVFVLDRNGAAAIMCAMCLAGLVGGRVAGVPDRVLLLVAAGLLVVLWMVWIDPPSTSSRKTSALAHTIGGMLAGWALVEALRRRISDSLAVALLALIAVTFLTVVWELGEYAGDRLLDTALVPRKRDSAEDIFFGTFGGAVGVAFGMVVASLRRGG
jgi:hypothetical protein